MFIMPEAIHSTWNDARNGLRRAGKQFTLLLSSILNNNSHGPFKGGRNHQSLAEAAADLGSRLSEAEFATLVEGMWADQSHLEEDQVCIPETPSEIQHLPAIQNLPPFATHLVAF